MKPIFALHKDAGGNVLTAGAFQYDHEKGPWLRALDLRPGDRIEIGELAKRPEFDEVEPAPQPAIQPPVRPEPALVGDDQPL